MSGRARSLLQATAAVLGLVAMGVTLWWATGGTAPAGTTAERTIVERTPESSGLPVATAPEAPSPTSDDVVATVVPTTAPLSTPTPEPTPTPLPQPRSFVELLGRTDLADDLVSPLAGCALHGGELSIAGTRAIRCIDQQTSVEVTAAGAGRIVHISTQPATAVVDLIPDGVSLGSWSWAAQAALGPHVVVDHGPWAGSSSTQTVYAGLSSIDSTLVIGQPVAAGDVIGAIDGPWPVLEFSLWQDNRRGDGASVTVPGPDIATQTSAAQVIGAAIMSPTDPRCPLSLGSTQLPGASRSYRNGTHQGIDFGCGTADRFATAIADGTVVYLIDDYVDPTVADREALLRNAGLAGFTPHWTLVMLYGNVVVIDHGEWPGAGRLVTIAAHLEAVDPSITLGSSVVAGQVLGELGNRGTNASAQGLRGAQDPSLHLHWELFVDNWYLGSGLPPVDVERLVVTALCDSAATAGCPA